MVNTDIGNFIPLRDFFKNPEQTNFTLSKSGKYIAFLKPWEKRLNLFVQRINAQRLPEGGVKQITFLKDRNVLYYLWKGDSTIIYFKDKDGNENFCPYAVDVNSGQERALITQPNARTDLLDSLTDISETDILVASNLRDITLFDVYRLNVITGEMNLAALNFGNVEFWCADHNGVVRLALQSDGLTSRVFTRASEKEEFKQILEFDYTYQCYPLLFNFDNQSIYFSSNLFSDKCAIVRIDAITGKKIETIFSHPDVDVEWLGSSRKRKVITEAQYTTWKTERKFFDQKMEAIYQKIKNIVGDKVISLPSANEDEDLFIVSVSDDKSSGSYYIYDTINDTLTFIADTNPWLPQEKLASMLPVQYKTRDGITIHGYLTLPLHSSKKNLPVVINPHGGPWARDIWGYNEEVQFLANRGYAVLQMNFRGSTGYGRDFFTKGFKQWGRAMQDDITDGVEWLIDQGIADPKRIGIYGCSYGGYAALCGVTLTPNLYACCVDYVGISNLFTFMDTMPPYWESIKQKFKAMIGDPDIESKYLSVVSPVHNADRIIAPLMVVQGANDPRVNIDESNQIVNAVRKRGIDVEYILKHDEGHGFHNEENIFDFYEAMEVFLAKHLALK